MDFTWLCSIIKVIEEQSKVCFSSILPKCSGRFFRYHILMFFWGRVCRVARKQMTFARRLGELIFLEISSRLRSMTLEACAFGTEISTTLRHNQESIDQSASRGGRWSGMPDIFRSKKKTAVASWRNLQQGQLALA